MAASSSEIIDAAKDVHLRDRLNALRPVGTTDQQVYDKMTELVKADVGEGHTIAQGYRFALGRAGLRAGADPTYVTDAQLWTALSTVFEV